MVQVRAVLEEWQVAIYLAAIVVGALAGFGIPKASALEAAINPALAFMLFVTFLQVPLRELGTTLRNTRFLGALLATNVVVIPVVVALLVQVLPRDPMLRLAVLLVLLTPCIDYVVTFTHLGHGDTPARRAPWCSAPPRATRSWFYRSPSRSRAGCRLFPPS